jgi:hypothetical protein
MNCILRGRQNYQGKENTNIVRSLIPNWTRLPLSTRHKSELMRQALKENDWRQKWWTVKFTERKYAYHGSETVCNRWFVFRSYEAIQGALFGFSWVMTTRRSMWGLS